MPGVDLEDDLAQLARHLRVQLVRHAAAGTWAAPGGPTSRTAAAAPTALLVPVEAIASHASTGARSNAERCGEEIEDEPIVRHGRRTLAQIRGELGECTRCKLAPTRHSIVFGVGSEEAPLMFVGEAPGEQEDKRGEPFVGRAGELLDRMIEAMGWTRDTVYIANTLMCRPPGNRNPQPDELEQCMPFLRAKIDAIAPRVIVALGRPAANQLLGTDSPISALRGKFHDRFGARIMPTFHPAYLLREPDRKRDAWADLKLVIAELARLGIAPPRAPRA
jgi:DNA polymerase